MEENITELIPGWCDENFDVVLARNVDEYERFSRFATVSEKNNKKPIKLMYKRNRFRFVVRVYCNRSRMTSYCVKSTKSHGTRLRLRLGAVLFSSFHAMMSSVIYYSTQSRQNEICLLNSEHELVHGKLSRLYDECPCGKYVS